MSTINEDRIRERLEALSQAGPAKEATDRAMEKVRDALMAGNETIPKQSLRLPPANGGASPTLQLMKLAAAAVLMIGLGYLGGRLSAPAPVDAEQLRAEIESSLRASLEPAIRQDLLAEMDARWDSAPVPLDAEQLRAEIESSIRASLEPAIRQDLIEEMDARRDSAFAAGSAELKEEFQQKVRRDLMDFAEQTLSYADDRMDRRLAELARQFYAARVQDRQRTAEGFQYLESNIGSGLVALAARADELMSTKQN